MKVLDFFKQPPSELSEDNYKGMIFNFFMGMLCLFAVISVLFDTFNTLYTVGEDAHRSAGYILGDIVSAVLWGLIWLGHRRYPKIARHIFLLSLIIAIIFFFQIEDRYILVTLTIPIMMSAFLIRPISSFAYLAVIVGAFAYKFYLSATTDLNDENNYIGLMALLAIAVVAWFIARSLDHALNETRALNRELDRRVQERTKELAAALRREHTLALRNKIILESIADGVLVFDTHNKIILANPAANRLAKHDLQSFEFTDFLNTIEEKAGKTIQQWMVGQKPDDINHVSFEWHNRAISANVAPVMLPGTDNGQSGGGNVMVLRDFTKEAELEKAKNVFLGMVSHELRTPMTSIQGYVDVLLAMEKERVSTEGYEYLQTISTNIRELLNLANELIDLSRMETGEIELYRQWVNIDSVVSYVSKTVRQEFTKRNLTLEIKLDHHVPDLYLDRNRINQVLLNLLSNAYKYTKEGGATIEVSQSEDWVNIAVSDTGVGISKTDQNKLFQRFFRASDRTVQKAGGTGLGLNISKGLIELHGGELTFTSCYGEGTTFTVSLPKNQVVPDDDIVI